MANSQETLACKADRLRARMIQMVHDSATGHLGGSLSCMDMLVALYYGKMRYDPQNPQWDDRDRFVLSKGHVCPALYVVLADVGFFPQEDLRLFRRKEGHLQGHPDMHKTPGVDMSTGSLGQGVSAAVGMAIAAKHRKKNFHVYSILGDGELQEGLVWEAFMAANHYHLDNLTVLIDKNNLQMDGTNDEVMTLGDLAGRMRAFGFEVVELSKGNDPDSVLHALNLSSVKPKCILCHTVKGKGVSYMENRAEWHAKVPTDEQLRIALEELGGLA